MIHCKKEKKKIPETNGYIHRHALFGCCNALCKLWIVLCTVKHFESSF